MVIVVSLPEFSDTFLTNTRKVDELEWEYQRLVDSGTFERKRRKKTAKGHTRKESNNFDEDKVVAMDETLQILTVEHGCTANRGAN